MKKLLAIVVVSLLLIPTLAMSEIFKNEDSKLSLKTSSKSGFTHHTNYMDHNDYNFQYIKDETKARAGKYFQRFELRDGDCFGDDNWNDCENNRERVEFSAEPQQRPIKKQCYGYSLKLSKELSYDSGKSLALYQLGVYYNNLDKLDSAKYYYNSSLKIAHKINNSIYKSQAYRGLAIIEFSQGNLIKADSINNMDLANTIENKDSIGTALAYDFKGTINQNKGYYKIALNNVLKGLKLFEELNDSIRIADSYNHLATIENNLGNLKNANVYILNYLIFKLEWETGKNYRF